MEDKKLKTKLEDFLVDKEKSKEKNEVIVETRTGLIERIDKTLVTKDGRQLLREIY